MAWSLAEILSRHLPKGVFQLLMGAGEVGSALCESAGVDAVSFTGSVSTGSKIAAAVHARSGRLQMEMGGKNPLIIMEDADLKLAVKYAIAGAFHSTGQRCTASSRLIVAAAIHDRFVAELISAMHQLRVGDALDPQSQIGPMVSEAQLRRTLDYIEIGRSEGAELALGGERLERERPGFYVGPALFVGTSSAQRINQEEIFGPVATVIKVAGIDEAIATANDTPFGLSAGIMTNTLSHVLKFRKKIRSGMAMVNLPTVGTDYHVPFGGSAASGHGPKELGVAAREFFTVTHTIYTST
jgi:aldehyde dehydrogenase (NAD+)